jgi:hypothetical protein
MERGQPVLKALDAVLRRGPAQSLRLPKATGRNFLVQYRFRCFPPRKARRVKDKSCELSFLHLVTKNLGEECLLIFKLSHPSHPQPNGN